MVVPPGAERQHRVDGVEGHKDNTLIKMILACPTWTKPHNEIEGSCLVVGRICLLTRDAVFELSWVDALAQSLLGHLACSEDGCY